MVERSSYLGLVCLFLIHQAWFRRADLPARRFWWAALTLLIVLGMGAFTTIGSTQIPLPSAWLWKILPNFRMMRVPGRFNLFVIPVRSRSRRRWPEVVTGQYTQPPHPDRVLAWRSPCSPRSTSRWSPSACRTARPRSRPPMPGSSSKTQPPPSSTPPWPTPASAEPLDLAGRILAIPPPRTHHRRLQRLPQLLVR